MATPANTSQDVYDHINTILTEFKDISESLQLAYIRSLDETIEATVGENPAKVRIRLQLQEKAYKALPEATKNVLDTSKGGISLAIELVRRDLTEYPALTRTLYTATEEQRNGDLRRLYNALSPVTEMHGALMSAGIDVEQREWAAKLVSEIPNLRRLRSTPWFEVALLLKIITVDPNEFNMNTPDFDVTVRVGKETNHAKSVLC